MAHRPRNVLVTGGCGFIGSNYVNHIFGLYPDATIVNLDKLILKSDAHHVDEGVRGSDRYHLVTGDICNQELVTRTLQLYNIDTIVHFAADCTSTYCYSNPAEACRNNIISFVQFLDAVRGHAPLRRFVHVSTDEVYGDSGMGEGEEGKTEMSLPSPSNPYAATKVAGEAFVQSYRMSYKLPLVMVRINNIYGPHQWDVKLMPKFIKLAYHRKEFTIQGSGGQLRSWLFVSDACAGICRVLEEGVMGEVYNIGSPFEMDVLSISTAIQTAVDRQMGREGDKEEVRRVDIKDRPYNDQRYLLDTHKIESTLGWRPIVPFEEGLAATVASEIRKIEGKKRPYSEKVLIYGGGGWIGEQLCALMDKVGIDYVRAKCRVGEVSDAEVRSELLSVHPTHLLCCTGRTHGPGCNTIDYLDGSLPRTHENVRDNLYSVLRLAQLSEELGMHMTYVGTAYVFDSYARLADGVTEPTVVQVDDVAQFCGNQYSLMKCFAERLLSPYLRNTLLNLRLNMPINFDMKSDRNLLAKISKYPMLFDVQCSFSVLPDLLPVLLDMMCARQTGTVNFVNPGTTSLHALRRIVQREEGEWERVDISDDRTKTALAKRPMVVMDARAIEENFPSLLPVEESVARGSKEN